MLVETSNLLTIPNFAQLVYNNQKGRPGVSRQRVHYLCDNGTIKPIIIDDVLFINLKEYEHLTKPRKEVQQ